MLIRITRFLGCLLLVQAVGLPFVLAEKENLKKIPKSFVEDFSGIVSQARLKHGQLGYYRSLTEFRAIAALKSFYQIADHEDNDGNETQQKKVREIRNFVINHYWDMWVSETLLLKKKIPNGATSENLKFFFDEDKKIKDNAKKLIKRYQNSTIEIIDGVTEGEVATHMEKTLLLKEKEKLCPEKKTPKKRPSRMQGETVYPQITEQKSSKEPAAQEAINRPNQKSEIQEEIAGTKKSNLPWIIAGVLLVGILILKAFKGKSTS